MPSFRAEPTGPPDPGRVKIWVDAQLSPEIARWLRDSFGVDASALKDLGLRDAEDHDIFFAARAARIVISESETFQPGADSAIHGSGA